MPPQNQSRKDRQTDIALGLLGETRKGHQVHPLLARDDVRRHISLPVLVNVPTRQSAIGHLLSCPRYYLFADRRGLRTKTYKSAASIGTWFHTAMKLAYMGVPRRKIQTTIVGQAIELRDKLLDNKNSDRDLANVQQLERIDKDATLALAMVDFFLEQYPVEPDFKVVLTEKEITAPVEGLHLSICGTLDCVLYSKSLKGYFIMDHKTIGQSTREWALPIRLDLQPKIYRLLLEYEIAQGNLPKGKVLGFVHNLIRRPGIRQKEWQDYETFVEEVKDYYRAEDDVQGSTDEEGEVVVFKTGPRKGLPKPRWEHAHQKEEWEKNPPIMQSIMEFPPQALDSHLRHALIREHAARTISPRLANFPPDGIATGKCRQNYGRPCEFIDFCTKPENYWQDLIAQSFVQEVPSYIEEE